MIIRCPGCGAGCAVRYRNGRNPRTVRCSLCGNIFTFFPALEIEYAGQSWEPVAFLQGARNHGPSIRTIQPPPSPQPPRVLPGARKHEQRGRWPVRLAGFLTGVVLLTTLVGQALVHERAALTAHPELAIVTDTLCRYLRCPESTSRAPAAIRISALDLEHLTGERMRVTMEIMNNLDRPQPWPLLEITVSDLFGRTLGQARWHPIQYLGPDQRNDGTIPPLEARERRRLRLLIELPSPRVEGVTVTAL